MSVKGSKVLLAAVPYSPFPRGPAHSMKRVYSITEHFYCLADRMSDTGAFDPCICPGPLSQVLVSDSPAAPFIPYDVPISGSRHHLGPFSSISPRTSSSFSKESISHDVWPQGKAQAIVTEAVLEPIP